MFVVLVAAVVYVLGFFVCLLKRERCEYKTKEPRQREKQKGLQVKAFDGEHT